MPRRKPVSDDQLVEPVLPLPTPRVVHRREHEVNPYESPPGAVALISEKVAPLKRRMTAAERRQRAELQADQQMRATRYARYVKLRMDYQGDEEKALAEIFPDLTPEAIHAGLERLLEDVRTGLVAHTVAKELERNDLGLAAQMQVLARHVYSDNPAASLKGLDMVREISGVQSNLGSWEEYARMAKRMEK